MFLRAIIFIGRDCYTYLLMIDIFLFCKILQTLRRNDGHASERSGETECPYFW